MSKRILSLMLAAVMLFSACGSKTTLNGIDVSKFTIVYPEYATDAEVRAAGTLRRVRLSRSRQIRTGAILFGAGHKKSDTDRSENGPVGSLLTLTLRPDRPVSAVGGLFGLENELRKTRLFAAGGVRVPEPVRSGGIKSAADPREEAFGFGDLPGFQGADQLFDPIPNDRTRGAVAKTDLFVLPHSLDGAFNIRHSFSEIRLDVDLWPGSERLNSAAGNYSWLLLFSFSANLSRRGATFL